MPKAVGYETKPTKSKKWRQERARAQDLFEYAARYRQASRENVWRQSERQYKGDHWVGDWTEDDYGDRIVVNMSFSTVNTIVPYVTGNEPSFYVEPYLRPANKHDANVIKGWLNRIWRHSGVNGQEHLETVATDSMMYGDGFMQVYWDLEDVETGDVLREPNASTRANIWVERTSPWDVWIDPLADGIHNARFVCVRVTTPLSQIKADDRYHNTSELGAHDIDPLSREDRDIDDAADRYVVNEDDRDKLIDLIEFYDLVEDRLVVFVADVEYPIRVVDGVDLPIFQLKNYRMPRSPYGMSELEQLWPLQQELNKTRTQMIQHRARNTAKWMARLESLEEGGVEALKSDIVNDVIGVKGNQPFDTVLAPLQMPQMEVDAYQVSDLVTRDIYEISGVNEYLRGATPQVTRTATEASIMESASNVKSSYKLRQVEKLLRKVGQHFLNVAAAVYPQTALDEFRMVVTGRDAQEMAANEQDEDPSSVIEGELTMDAQVFEGEYEVFVETGSTEMTNPRFREEKYKDMFLTLLQAAPILMQLGQQPPNLSKVLELWLEAAGIENIDTVLQPDQGMQQAMMQQQMMAQMGGAEEGGDPNQTVPGLGQTAPGQPEPGNVGPPMAQPSADNTGAIPPQ